MWLVFLKELKELVRDKKTLFFMIAVPILVMPAFAGIAIYFAQNAATEAQNKVLNYALIGGQYAPDIDAKLMQIDGLKRVEINQQTDYKKLIQENTVDFVLEIPANYSDDVLQSGQALLKLHLNDSGLNRVFYRVNEIVDEQLQKLRASAFAKLNLSEEQQIAVLNPIILEKVNTADSRENWGEKIGGLIPYFIFILCLQGAMFPAADLGAGEKERGTLETLLISPIERYKLVLGKFLTIAFAGLTSALITVTSMALWGLILSQGLAIEFVVTFMSSIGAVDFILMFLMLIPVVAIFASILLSLSIYAKSYKEAQSYMGTLMMLLFIPIFLAMAPGVELKGIWAWVPLTNVALAIKELIKGTMDYFQLIAIFGSTALIAAGLLAFCVNWFNKEKVLFR
ncbi:MULTISPECIES: ABC transporter permease [Aliiglaciecola]|uniref:ABC transporter permease n=1 Tax=Aliiglaciecola TaxID=1406885 RepID=UPI001C0A0329|nr:MULTISPECIES: ABC transporter permease [Aliiglaciecola]MBU2880017.1 ABC transporter permease [Aliiglaciecola lipolytica]MDO6710985.1 ABC transporter permease [Aliiglaciecola sp. 2_MG-2023]MDO6752466.1 ABC transporter permease [Aliiglaciecola sp. 1_MG-2023]